MMVVETTLLLRHSTLEVHPLDHEFRFLRVYTVTTHKHVVLVVLNRPPKRNAIHARMWKEIGSIFTRLGTDSKDTDCRAIILTGNGSDFCSGIDFTDTTFLPNNKTNTDDDDDDVARIGISFLSKLREMQNCFTALETCPIPVIASIHGNCIGAGMDLICAADIRICTLDAQFSVREVAMGLAADVGTLQRFPKIVGNQSMVRELCYTGRNMDAKEAQQIGFVSHIIPTENILLKALELASIMVGHSPVAVQNTKKSLLYSRDHSVSDGLEQIALQNALSLQGSDTNIAWMAKTMKTTPVFSPMLPHSRL